MFTGIIASIGSIRALTPKGGDVRVYVETGKLDLSDVQLGDSIAVNGVCLTAVELPGDGFWADVSVETLKRTAFIDLKSGSKVNLEKALTPTTRLGGHLVSGHVDGVGEIISRSDNARAIQFRVRAPKELAKYIAHKGSITVDGTSLTVNEVLLEAGASLVGAFARLGLVDEYQLFVAGTFLGSHARPLLDWPMERMSEAPRLKITEMRAVGDDWRVTAVPLPAPGV